MFTLKRKPVHPGKILKEEFIEPFNISQTQLSNNIGVAFKAINEIINEKRDISPEMAVKLSRYFGTTSNLWLNLQNQYDVYSIIEKKEKEINRIVPYKDLVKAA